MEKQKRWQLYLIIAVMLLTIYNILPTVFYYTKPLREPVNQERALTVAEDISKRVNTLEDEAVSWLYSFTNMLQTNPKKIELDKEDPRLIHVQFPNAEEAKRFVRFLPQAGARIPFVPSQLTLYTNTPDEQHTILVARQVDVHVTPSEVDQLFQFSSIEGPDGKVSPLYKEIIFDRFEQIALAFGGPSKEAQQIASVIESPTDPNLKDIALGLANEIVETETTFGATSPITKRYFASFTQINDPNRRNLIDKFSSHLDTLSTQLSTEKEKAERDLKVATEETSYTDLEQEQTVTRLQQQVGKLNRAKQIIQNNKTAFNAGLAPLTKNEVEQALATSFTNVTAQNPIQKLSLNNRNPFIESLTLDWNNGTIETLFYENLNEIRLAETTTETEQYLKDKLNLLVISNIARVARLSDETITPSTDGFEIELNKLLDTKSFLTLNLGSLAEKKANQLIEQIKETWNPQHPDLTTAVFPVNNFADYQNLPSHEKKLGLVIYAPSTTDKAPLKGFRNGSIYVIANGLSHISEKYKDGTETGSQLFATDLKNLNDILQKNGFIGYPASGYETAAEFNKSFIFEQDDYYSNFLKATREDFSVHGTKRFAVLDFTDVEQRILTANAIDNQIQENLLKWKEDYQAMQVDLNAANKFLVPPPTKSPFWQNLKLGFTKYFRGDESQVLKWGLDLSGGKTVRIGLRDHNNRPVTSKDDLNQAVNELYTRVNKMGVAERTIQIENNNIVLDFPGSQAWSAAELIKASAMYFHIVNEKFSPYNKVLGSSVNEFLQNVWNEAVVTNRKDIESINEIAYQHLGGDSSESPRSHVATVLYENGLRLSNPKTKDISSEFNDTFSAITMLRGDDFQEWNGQSHPLVVTFHNYALEGSSLTNVQVGYDPKSGNVLSFTVKRSYEGSDRGGSPREDLYAWTSQFSEEKIVGTPREAYSGGRGWRMAVVLNERIISMPSLNAALSDGGTISGRFSQREINQLAADLKAGSLSFTPKILSEQNVSPELGKEERTRGITAALISLAIVAAVMMGYYRFAGLVATCAVFMNLLIMWGILQNLGAALTLPGIAAIVLTIGMSIDANVLVFERFREEFKISGRIASAIQAAYRKAFSAIIDSNITTILAALILIQFDSGPIRGFAITLIIGILSSMFTALFMTRYFFAGWVQNPKHKELKMAQFISNTNFNFLKQTKAAIIISVIITVLGGYLFLAQGKTILGMDFTGGYSLTLELQEQPDNPNYRLETANALIAQGASSTEVDVRELTLPNQLRIQLGVSMEEAGHPFHNMPEALSDGKYEYEYLKNPRLTWIVHALEKQNLQIQNSELTQLDRNWAVVNGQFSDTMRNNAILALSLALLSILIYISIRFEFKYGVSAVIGLAHDVIITLGILAFFHWIGFAVQIDLTVIGAIMTIIGYSLNDTIIVFDRIREDVRILRKLSYSEVINHALNVTLSRTLMTSGSTLLVLLTLTLLGGNSIFGFSLIMTIGVLVGTLSSLFVAPAMLLYLHGRENTKTLGLHKA